MNFELSDTQALLRDTAERMAREVFDFHARRELFEADPAALPERWDAIAALGLPAILVPETQGGMGGGMHDIGPVLEAFGGAMVVEAFAATAVTGAGLLARTGQDGHLPAVAAGALRLALAYAERHSRHRLDGFETRVEGGKIDGAKLLVQGGASADRFIVAARDGEDTALYLVAREAEGVEVVPARNLDLSDAAEVHLRGVAITPADRLPGDGRALLEWALDRTTAAACAEAVGAMEALHRMTLDHLRTRHAFGRSLGGFQVLQHRIVDMIVATEQARSITLLALDRADDEDLLERRRAVSAAKVQVSRSARFVAEQAMQLHGAMAITLEHPVGYFAKRLAVFERLHGDVEHHLARFADAAGY